VGPCQGGRPFFTFVGCGCKFGQWLAVVIAADAHGARAACPLQFSTQLLGSLGIVAAVHFVVVGWTFGKQASKKESKEGSQKARKKASKRQRKQASKKASNKQESKQEKKQESKQASNQAKQASNQAIKQASKKCGDCCRRAWCGRVLLAYFSY
jgi:uncharacterized protein HemX